MDTGALIFLFVVFVVAFGIGGLLANRVYPVLEGEHWSRAGKRNVVRHMVGWGVLIASGAAILLLPIGS